MPKQSTTQPISILLRFVFLAAIILSACSDSIAETPATNKNEKQPNVLWLSVEDIGPQIGCYGDPNATTPNLNALASNSLTYDVVWSNYPVCGPARTTIISGMYASSCAAGNMRSEVVMPEGVEMFPYFLRDAGYYCTNNKKEDYNFITPKNDPWDESSNKAHYRNRKEDQPFFAVFNYTGTHESKIRKRPHEAVIDASKIVLPKYYPDIPEIKQDWAQYLDNITVMDSWVQKHLDALEKSGEADNTIVIFFGDHGGGMPRHKRYAGNSGMHVPFIVHVPEKLKENASPDYKTGGRTNRPVGFVDLAPTVLSIAGIKPPEYMQGNAFLGAHQTEAPKYVYGMRERMDERPDLSRSIRDERFVYIRNFLPHLPAGQFVQYQQETQSTSLWFKMFKEGKLNDIQSQFWKPRAAEELYDLVNDPEETVNLAADPKFANELRRFQNELKSSMKRFGDLGLIPEPIALEFGNREKSRRLMLGDSTQFPLDEIFEIANLASSRIDAGNKLVAATKHSNASVRYWGTIGMLVRGSSEFDGNEETIAQLMNDKSDAVAIVAAELLANFGDEEQKKMATAKLCQVADFEQSNLFASVAALNVLDRLESLTQSNFSSLKGIPTHDSGVKRGNGYVEVLKRRIMDKEMKKN